MGERRGTKGLELWCRKMTEGYPGVKIDNMTTSWRDGLAFCAIIHHFRPDLIEFSKLNKDDVYHNNELAFRVAEHHLGIPALLEPEDMVEYTVPDRLSILTYLSQFYQAFAVPQGSTSARIAKRPQSSPDHGIVTPTSTSPPSKVAFTGAGRIRREPCAKCSLPVFIAERLNVGKLLYHRTCFRCARCSSQLTLANYYETENGEFCCEICPDEEKLSTKTSPEKSVLFRSMSDEEKSASLKTFSNGPDDYSAQFETALESVQDDNLKKEFTLTRSENECTKARSSFFQSQMEESGDSGNEDIPPDLPKSVPPILDKSELGSEDTLSLKDSVVINDSGFPGNRLEATVNIDSCKSSVSNQETASVELDKIHNIVTKETFASEADTSLVRARMRLFESNKSIEFGKSDVHRKPQNTDNVPLSPVKSPSEKAKSTPIPIVKLDDLENFEQLSKIEMRSNVNIIDHNKVSTEKSIPLYEDPHSVDNAPDKYVEDEKDEGVDKSQTIDKESPEDEKDEGVDISQIIDQESPGKVEKEIESPSLPIIEEILTKNDLKDIITVEDSMISIQDTSNETENSIICIEESPPANEDTSVTPSTTIDSLSDTSYNTPDVSSPGSVSKAEYNTTDDVSPGAIAQKLTPGEEDYPDDLNPFGDDDEDTSVEQKQAISLNPFDDEEDDTIAIKPTPSPRLRKKLFPTDTDKAIFGTPDHLSRVKIDRISVNPFESDDEESGDMPPMPAARKKKVVAAPKISLNPFWSEDEENEQANVKQPVPRPRMPRTSLGVPEPKPRESGALSLDSRSTFGSNSSISSSSAFGSVRKKKPAPRPPIATKNEHYESNASSMTSSPSHSVQHSPSLTPKYRKSKRAPPPPSCSTPLPPRKEPASDAKPSSTAISPIHVNTDDSALKEPEPGNTQLAENDIEQEKIVKDEMNRNRQSHKISLPSPTSSENSASLSAPNKSTYGKWKRRKGLAPTRPIPQKRMISCLPVSEIRKELDIIEIQQQGLEKQGVRLEQIIREKCEGTGTDSTAPDEDSLPVDVEDLILQLFELVNEKNELFRKQAELMYLRRQQRLEEEHADVEYQIRCLMCQPEANKTDSDKAKEEELINRLVEIVERRNEIIECLEMDRVREAEEDDSINSHINLYTLKRDGEKLEPDAFKKEKDKKKHKEKKFKLKNKGHKVDADKDIDESEPYSTLEKKKKKKFNIF